MFIFNKTILNIFFTLIPQETIVADEKDPPWFTKNIKQSHSREKQCAKSYRNSKKNNNMQFIRKLKFLQEDLNDEIEISKLNCHSWVTYKLNHIQENSKAYLALLKLPFIPPFFHGNENVKDFKKKAELFNLFLAK